MTRARAVGACIALSICFITYGWCNAETDVGHRVQATLLKTGSSVHTSLSNHDSYLMRVSPHHGQSFVARVTDDFPSYVDRMPESLRRQGATFSVVLRRASFCDNKAPAQDGTEEPARCFSLVHGSWKSDKLQDDEWWK